jgi:hypothetical protein
MKATLFFEFNDKEELYCDIVGFAKRFPNFKIKIPLFIMTPNQQNDLYRQITSCNIFEIDWIMDKWLIIKYGDSNG